MINFAKSEWNGFERLDFTLFDTACIVVKPKKAREGNPFVFRMEFFDAFPWADIAMCHEGYHVVYIDAHDKYGHDNAVEIQHKFHLWLIENMNLAEKAVLFGFSRGCLYTINYTYHYSENVSVIYLDAPVCNILSWPAGKGKGTGTPECWTQLQEVYGMSEGQLLSYRGNPVDRAEFVAEKKIPVMLVVGLSDTLVPYEENSKIFAERFVRAGGEIEIIEKPGCEHHPHSLEEPKPIVDFILAHDKQ